MVDPVKSHSDLLHSKPIDLHKSCYNKEFWLLRDAIYNNYFKPLHKHKKSIAKRHLLKILIDVYQAWYFDPSLCLSVSFNNNTYTLDNRYNKLKLTKNSIIIIKDLIASGLLYHKDGMPARTRYRTGPSYTSRVWPTNLLIKYFLGLQLNVCNISAHDIDKEPIILTKKVMLQKDPQKPGGITRYKNVPIDYSDTPRIRTMRLILACYNLFLRKTHIDICTAENYYVTAFNEWGIETKCFISPNCFMHRTFINNTFNKGGRIYGGWWQKCHSVDRKNILINGNPIVEIAYKAAHLAILYRIEGQNLYDLANDRDIYDVIIPELDNVTDSELINYSRTELTQFKSFLIKQLTHNAITTTNENDLWRRTIKAITSEEYTAKGNVHRPPPSILNKISYKFLSSIYGRIRQKHQKIAHYFLSGVGPKLQFIESNITMKLIEHFTALKVPILTIHDTYIIEQKWGQTLINAMQCGWDEEISNLKKDLSVTPKRSRYLKRLTHNKNGDQTPYSLTLPIKIDNWPNDYSRKVYKISQLKNVFRKGQNITNTHNGNIQAAYKERFDIRDNNMFEIQLITPDKKTTERYQKSFRIHKDWLSEGDTEDDTPEINERYNSFYASINSKLYSQWLHFKPLWMQSE